MPKLNARDLFDAEKMNCLAGGDDDSFRKNSKCISLYEGDVHLHFDERYHQYFRVLADRKTIMQVPSSTQILGLTVDKSAALKWWAAGCGRDFFLQNVKPGNAYDEIEIESIADGIYRAHNLGSKQATNVGKLVHDFCQRYAKDPTTGIPHNEEAKLGAQGFLLWVELNEVKFLRTERVVYSMAHDYCGTVDTLAVVNGNLAVVDYKTSTDFYPEMDLQLSSYYEAVNEELRHLNLRELTQQWVLRLDKETGKFHAREIPVSEFKYNRDAFIAAHQLAHRLVILEAERQKEKDRVKVANRVIRRMGE